MAQVDLANYKNIYLQTAKEYLSKMQIDLDKLSKNLLDKAALKDLYISSHSLSSQSQTMKLTEIHNLTLSVENTLRDLMELNAKLNNQTISDIKKSVEMLEGMIRELETDQTKVAHTDSNGKT